MRAKEARSSSETYGWALAPTLEENVSDSASFDNGFELIVRRHFAGCSHAVDGAAGGLRTIRVSRECAGSVGVIVATPASRGMVRGAGFSLTGNMLGGESWIAMVWRAAVYADARWAAGCGL